jgi:uncharacterized protein
MPEYRGPKIEETLMNVRAALIAVALFAAGPLVAQTSSTGTPPKPPAHQPGVAAQPAHAPGQAAKAPSAAASADKPDAAKEAAIRHLMDITETSKMGDSISLYVINQVRQVLSQALPPDRLAKLMTSFSQKLAATAPASAITDAAVPIYAKAFSMEDIQALIQFYESPLGKRVVKTLPQVAQESEQLGVQMQQKGAMTVLQDMSADYPELKQMLQPPAAGSGASPAPEKAPAPEASPAPKPAPAPPSK